MHHSSHNSEKWIHTRYEFYKNFSTDKNSWKCSFVQHSSQSQSRRFTAAWMIMNLGMLHHLMVIDQFTGASELWQLYGVVGIQLFFLKKTQGKWSSDQTRDSSIEFKTKHFFYFRETMENQRVNSNWFQWTPWFQTLKGQLISKTNFKVFISTKKPTKFFLFLS